MVGPGDGLLPADCLLRAGQPAAKPIVKSAVLATIKSWGDMWGKTKCTDEIVKHFADTDVHDALKMLCEVCGRDAPVPRHDSVNRPKGEAFANDIHDLIKELDHRNELPEIVVSSNQIKFCPIVEVSDRDPGILVRMERLERAVWEMLNKPPAVQAVQQPAVRGVTAAGLAAALASVPATPLSTAGGLFGPALERARSQSRGREARQRLQGGAGAEQGGAAGVQQQGGAAREQSGSRQETWAERTAKRSRPGDVDSEGFRVPG